MTSQESKAVAGTDQTEVDALALEEICDTISRFDMALRSLHRDPNLEHFVLHMCWCPRLPDWFFAYEWVESIRDDGDKTLAFLGVKDLQYGYGDGS